MGREIDIHLCSDQRCTGCMACSQACNHHAISLRMNEGFMYPEINKDLCRNCGLCMNVCPVLNINKHTGNKHDYDTNCIAAWHKDDAIRMQSSSGGSFSIMADKVIKVGGKVYGAAWDVDLQLKHRSVDNVSDLDILRRSKYVQSDINNTFVEVKADLKGGRMVMYCGTPCQIAGLNAYLGYTNYENLITVDVLCQGVPSQWSFSKYIKEIEDQKRIKITDCNFRSKNRGWRCGLLLLLLGRKSGKEKWYKHYLGNNEYYNAFIKEYFMRPSCYDCQFKCNHQGYYSDITIADFWRIGNNIPFELKTYEKGVSAVVINTTKGQEFFNKCASELETQVRTWKEFSTNGGLRSCKKPTNNDEAFEYLKSHTWRETQNLFFPITFRRRISTYIQLLLGGRRLRTIYKLTGKIR